MYHHHHSSRRRNGVKEFLAQSHCSLIVCSSISGSSSSSTILDIPCCYSLLGAVKRASWPQAHPPPRKGHLACEGIQMRVRKKFSTPIARARSLFLLSVMVSKFPLWHDGGLKILIRIGGFPKHGRNAAATAAADPWPSTRQAFQMPARYRKVAGITL